AAVSIALLPPALVSVVTRSSGEGFAALDTADSSPVAGPTASSMVVVPHEKSWGEAEKRCVAGIHLRPVPHHLTHRAAASRLDREDGRSDRRAAPLNREWL